MLTPMGSEQTTSSLVVMIEMEKIWRDVEMKEQKFFVEDSMSDLLDILRAIILAEYILSALLRHIVYKQCTM